MSLRRSATSPPKAMASDVLKLAAPALCVRQVAAAYDTLGADDSFGVSDEQCRDIAHFADKVVAIKALSVRGLCDFFANRTDCNLLVAAALACRSRPVDDQAVVEVLDAVRATMFTMRTPSYHIMWLIGAIVHELGHRSTNGIRQSGRNPLRYLGNITFDDAIVSEYATVARDAASQKLKHRLLAMVGTPKVVASVVRAFRPLFTSHFVESNKPTDYVAWPREAGYENSTMRLMSIDEYIARKAAEQS